jgi:hypothetical protein
MGKAVYHFAQIDIITGTSESSTSLQKFPINYYLANDNYSKPHGSGAFLHYVPQGIKALQATNEPDAPSCAIIDSAPVSGLTLETVDDYCVNSAVVGDMSICDSSSDFYNSKVGYCSSLKKYIQKQIQLHVVFIIQHRLLDSLMELL